MPDFILTDADAAYRGHLFNEFVRLTKVTTWMTAPYSAWELGRVERRHGDLNISMKILNDKKAWARELPGAVAHAINTLVSDNAWLAGESLTIADISVVSMLTVLDRATEARNLMATQPALLHWQQRVDALTLPEGTTDNDRALA